MPRCKHQNGIFIEVMWATHTRIVLHGKIDNEGTNEIGNISHYEFRCMDCKKNFKIGRNSPKWLGNIHSQFH